MQHVIRIPLATPPRNRTADSQHPQTAHLSLILADMSISHLSGRGLDGWDQSRFEAFTKLLLLKSGRQVEEASSFIDIPSDETETSELKSIDSVSVNILSQFNEDKLKRAFLDRISELVANQKGDPHVSSSLMIEWPDRVDILVSRNAGLKKYVSNVEILEIIASNLRRISTLDRRGRC